MQDLLTRLLLAGGGGFSPSALFGGGAVQGAWYDPSDFGTTGTGGVGTLFQDAAGTTPVTAVEQPVGLMLDKSKGLVLGSELVTNGDFSQGSTGWTAGAGWSIAGGAATGAAASTNLLQTNVAPSPSGKTYRVTLTIVTRTAGSIVPAISGSSVTLTNPGTYTFYLFPTGSDATLYISGVGFTGTITNISVKALPGNHAFQSTSASRPTLRARYNLLTYSEEFNDAAWVKANSTITANSTTAPDGTLTADTFLDVLAAPFAEIRQTTQGIVSGVTYRYSIRAKQGTQRYLYLSADSGRFGANADAIFDLQTATVKSSGVGVSSPTCTPDANGFVVCAFTVTATSSGAAVFYIYHVNAAGTSVFYTGTGTGSVFLWGAQLVPTAVFPSNTYQRIGAATDYATGTAFPPYLFFDGTDDSMLTNSVDFATVTSDGQARRNLLNNPTQFDVTTSWPPTNITVTPNAGTAPNGTNTAQSIAATATANTLLVSATTTVSATSATYSVYAKQGTGANVANTFLIRNNTTATNLLAGTLNYSTGVFTYSVGSTGVSVQDAGNGWWRIIMTVTSGVTSGDGLRVYIGFTGGPETAGNFLLAWGAQLETGSTATAFQNIGTDQMTVFAGVTKNSDAATSVIAELSADVFSNNGAFWLAAPDGAAANNIQWRAGGTLKSNLVRTSAAPVTLVTSGQSDIGASNLIFRVNAAQTNSLATQGTGNYGNYPLYIGRRNNASLPFNGNLYSLIVQGATPTSSQLVSTEQWVAAKTPLGSV